MGSSTDRVLRKIETNNVEEVFSGGYVTRMQKVKQVQRGWAHHIGKNPVPRFSYLLLHVRQWYCIWLIQPPISDTHFVECQQFLISVLTDSRRNYVLMFLFSLLKLVPCMHIL